MTDPNAQYVRQLEKALRWYANLGNWSSYYDGMEFTRSAAVRDRGDRARQALRKAAQIEGAK